MMKKKKIFLNVIALWMVTMLLLSGCENNSGTAWDESQQQKVDVSESAAKQSKIASSPVKKKGGGKFRIAYVDIDEYPETGGMLYYVLENLKELGWIQYESLPMTADNVDAKKLINWLAERDIGPYVEFVSSANYYLAYEGEEYVGESLRDHVINKKDIDLIFAMGTWPGRFVKSLQLDVPLMVYGSVDPIGAGIIKSAEDSGDENIWAQVDTSAFKRQLQFYCDTINFTNIGMVYNDEIVAAISDYEKAAQENGFKITKKKIKKLESDKAEDKDKYYAELREIYRKMIEEDKIDAYLINTDVITDDTRMKDLFEMFYEKKIPVFVQVGDNYIKNGAFMQVSPRDYKGLGAFVANMIGAVFNGAKPGELPQEYTSSPYLSLNLDVAEKIDFTPSFEMLLSAEYIYTSGNADDN